MNNVPQVNFSLSELTAIVSLINGQITQRRDQQLEGPEAKKREKNMLLLETIKINLTQQIEHGDVRLLLSLEELYALIDAFVFYMLVLSFSIQQNPQETQENHKKIIAIQSVNVWRKRFKYILSEYYVDTTIS